MACWRDSPVVADDLATVTYRGLARRTGLTLGDRLFHLCALEVRRSASRGFRRGIRNCRIRARVDCRDGREDPLLARDAPYRKFRLDNRSEKHRHARACPEHPRLYTSVIARSAATKQ